jgi:sec-independent protein translocase protein TatB
MFDFSWPEMAIIAVVALVVIGPKDLPRVLRTAGQWVRRARSVAREFQGSLEQMVREAELEDVKEQLKKTASFDLKDEINKAVDPGGELKASLADLQSEPPLADPTLPDLHVPDAVLPESAPPDSERAPVADAPADVPRVDPAPEKEDHEARTGS